MISDAESANEDELFETSVSRSEEFNESFKIPFNIQENDPSNPKVLEIPFNSPEVSVDICEMTKRSERSHLKSCEIPSNLTENEPNQPELLESPSIVRENPINLLKSPPIFKYMIQASLS